jgi:hypothetical protein
MLATKTYNIRALHYTQVQTQDIYTCVEPTSPCLPTLSSNKLSCPIFTVHIPLAHTNTNTNTQQNAQTNISSPKTLYPIQISNIKDKHNYDHDHDHIQDNIHVRRSPEFQNDIKPNHPHYQYLTLRLLVYRDACRNPSINTVGI